MSPAGDDAVTGPGRSRNNPVWVASGRRACCGVISKGVRRLALYGSALRDDFGAGSDIDLLVEFRPDHIPGLLHLAQMELELEEALGRPVELRTPEDLSPYFRDKVTPTARPLYAA